MVLTDISQQQQQQRVQLGMHGPQWGDPIDLGDPMILFPLLPPLQG